MMNKIFKKARGKSPAREAAKARLPRQSALESQDSMDVVTLQVPTLPRIRSSSFDSSSLHQLEMSDNEGGHTLQVPENPTKTRRKKSFQFYGGSGSTSDEYGSDKEQVTNLLDVPKYFRRRSLEIPRLCIHCVHLEALSASSSQEPSPTSPGEEFGLTDGPVYGFIYSSSEDDDDSSGEGEGEEEEGDSGDEASNPTLPPVRSLPKEAFAYGSTEIKCYIEESENGEGEEGKTESTPHRSRRESLFINGESIDEGNAVITLKVPMLKPRSSSLDAGYRNLHGAGDERRASMDTDLLDVPITQRSSSVDVSLPTETDTYKAMTAG